MFMAAIMDEGIQEQSFFCPTFSSYSSDKLAEIAARVSNEFRNEFAEKADQVEEEDDDEFEFSLVLEDSSNFYYDGNKSQSEPVFPIFKLDFLADKRDDDDDDHRISDREIRIPLKELLKQEREGEEDDMANIPPGTYCVWKPKLKESSSSSQKICRKSKSTSVLGSSMSSKRWKILDLLRRSNSEGNESYIFLTPPKHRDQEKSDNHRPPPPSPARQQKHSSGRKTPPSPPPSAHEMFYVRNRAIKEGDKKKSYLPYRQVLVGFFANVNSLKKTYPPF